MNNRVYGIVTAMLLGVVSHAMAIESLRGDVDLQQSSSAISKHEQASIQGGFGRAYDLQPPMIPHNIERESISLRGNTCLRCHAPENVLREKAPAMSPTHFLDRGGNPLDQVSSRRFFCTQCHVPQVNAPPLVENTF